MGNTGPDEAQAGIKIAGRSINNLRYADDTTFMAESEEERKSLLMKVKDKSEKNWLTTQHSENKYHGIHIVGVYLSIYQVNQWLTLFSLFLEQTGSK